MNGSSKRPESFDSFPEFFIVEDADYLDAIGIIGLVRCAMNCFKFNRPMYSSTINDSSSLIGHYEEKLFKLPGLVTTKYAKDMSQLLTHNDQQYVSSIKMWQNVTSIE